MRIGVLGGGQLGRMLALAGIPLGHEFVFLDPDPDCPARAVGRVVVGAYDDPRALEELARGADVVTYEFENVPAASVERLAHDVPVFPERESLITAQDRILEKEFFQGCGIPVQAFTAVGSAEELARACGTVGFPGVLKTRRMGYDGKGQAQVRTPVDAPQAWRALGGVPCIYEEHVPFTHEVSAVAVRGRDGNTACYPLCRNMHAQGILRTVTVPAYAPQDAAGAALERAAVTYMNAALDALGHVGVLTIEFFVLPGKDGTLGLIANEMAPRVHNSAHWTQDGALTSQFENHVRALTGMPLGATDARGACGMVNLVGRTPPLTDLLAVPGAHVHLYGKTPRTGRKLGHVNVCAPQVAVRDAQMRVLTELVGRAADG